MISLEAKATQLLEAQEHSLARALAACQAKFEALQHRDFRALGDIIAELDLAIAESNQQDKQLAKLLGNMPGYTEAERFSALLEQVGDEAGLLLSKRRDRLKDQLDELRLLSGENIRLINDMLSDVNAAVQLLSEVMSAAQPTYGRGKSRPLLPSMCEEFA